MGSALQEPRPPWVRAGAGQIRCVVGPDPAAGAEVTITVPQTARWRVLGLRFQLVTDATVVNRQVDLVIDDGANVVLRIEPPAVQGAGGTRGYNYGPGLPARTVLTQEFLGALPVEAVLEGGWRIRTVTALLQAADNYNGVFLWVEEWLAP